MVLRKRQVVIEESYFQYGETKIEVTEVIAKSKHSNLYIGVTINLLRILRENRAIRMIRIKEEEEEEEEEEKRGDGNRGVGEEKVVGV
uniref:Uncharacterized protein n=1 Tax=Vespula pensylvanica TaxID=30213 RepID=A0A834NZ42_VESPE|nr:hypothetical protein H0235_009329 [Vespula pensylvanica]